MLINDHRSPKKSRGAGGRVSRIFNDGIQPINTIRDEDGRLIRLKAGASINILINQTEPITITGHGGDQSDDAEPSL